MDKSVRKELSSTVPASENYFKASIIAGSYADMGFQCMGFQEVFSSVYYPQTQIIFFLFPWQLSPKLFTGFFLRKEAYWLRL